MLNFSLIDNKDLKQMTNNKNTSFHNKIEYFQNWNCYMAYDIHVVINEVPYGSSNLASRRIVWPVGTRVPVTLPFLIINSLSKDNHRPSPS